MTAPDPGLTDLISSHSEGDYGRFGCATCVCGWRGDDHPAHVALVVEQHTNGRMAELEARVDEWSAEYRKGIQARDNWRARAEKAEAAIARVHEIRCGNCNNPLSEGSGNCVSDAGRPHIYDEADLRAALEGES